MTGAGAGPESVTAKENAVLPAFPSAWVTSPTVRFTPPPPQGAVETMMSSTPIHSSFPTAFEVMMRTSTSG